MEGNWRRRVMGMEEGRPWLPPHVIDAALKPVLYHENPSVIRRGTGAFLPTRVPVDPLPKPGRKSHRRKPRFSPGNNKHASGGPGMHAVFIDSVQRSSGTGVFLPRSVGHDLQRTTNSKPVLLPSRVMQVLSMNRQEPAAPPPITLLKERQNVRNYNTAADNKLRDGAEGKKLSSNCNVSPQTCDTSIEFEVLLPEEWSY